ncbi:MAG: hypothetical protein ABFC31_05020 [Clostridiaceae bacterium]
MKNTKRVLCLLAAFLFALSAASCSFTTAKVDSLAVTDISGNKVDAYTTADQTFYAQGSVSSAPDRTKITIVWTYVTTNQIVDQTEYYTEESSEVIPATLETSTSFPAGDYKVEFFVEDKEEPDATAAFTVTQVLASIEDAHMTSFMDEGGVPTDTITTVEPTGTWYVSAILRNTQPDTNVRFVWLDTTNGVIDEYTFDPEGKSDVYVGGTLALSQVAPEGTYHVEIYLDDKTTPEATVEFEVKNLNPEDAAAASADYSVYTQTEGGFTISYPTDWLDVGIPESLAAGFYPTEYEITGQDEVNAVLVVKVPDVGYTIDEALEEWIAETVAEENENYVNLDSTVDTVNGRDMAMFAYSWTRDGYSLYTFDFLVVNGADLYVITFTATEEALPTLYPYVEQMVLSFDIL